LFALSTSGNLEKKNTLEPLAVLVFSLNWSISASQARRISLKKK
jgi:hypothetical protein